MKRIPGIKPRFVPYEIVRPDGTVMSGWEMFIGDRSWGRSTTQEALLEAWEATLEEAEHGKPFAFRAVRNRPGGKTPDQAKGAKGRLQSVKSTRKATAGTSDGPTKKSPSRGRLKRAK